MTAPINARERSRLETRKRLLTKGTELFAAQGIAHTRTSDVAEAAGVAVGTLYLHFKDKRGLLREILFSGIDELLRALLALADHPMEEARKAVRIHAETMVSFTEENPALCRILFDPEATNLQVSTEIIDYLVQIQEKRLHEEKSNGHIRDTLDPAVTAQAMVGMCVQVLAWWIRNPEKATRKDVINTLSSLRLTGLYTSENIKRA